MASHMGRQSGFICRRKITLITIEYFTANMNLPVIVISIINLYQISVFVDDTLHSIQSKYKALRPIMIDT